MFECGWCEALGSRWVDWSPAGDDPLLSHYRNLNPFQIIRILRLPQITINLILPTAKQLLRKPEVSASQPDPTVVEGPEVAVSQPDPSTLILAEVRRTVGGFNLDFVRPEIVNWESTTLRIYCVWYIPYLAPPTLVSGLHWGDDCVCLRGVAGIERWEFSGTSLETLLE